MNPLTRFALGLIGSLFRRVSYELRGMVLTMKIRCSSSQISKNI